LKRRTIRGRNELSLANNPTGSCPAALSADDVCQHHRVLRAVECAEIGTFQGKRVDWRPEFRQGLIRIATGSLTLSFFLLFLGFTADSFPFLLFCVSLIAVG
jgi:hypothetical protein